MDHEYCIGDFVWTCWDYLGESGIGHILYDDKECTWGLRPYPYHAANCGDFDLCGTRRTQSYYHEVVWGKRLKPYIAVMDPKMASKRQAISDWGFTDLLESWTFAGCENMHTKVYVYALGDECELLVNGVSLKRQPFIDGACIFEDIPYQPGEIKAIVYQHGAVMSESILTTAGQAERCSIERVWEGDELIYADIVIRDEKGNQVHDAPFIQVYAENGTVLAMGNGDAQSEEQYPVNGRHAWRGRATVIVKKQGAVSLRAIADGLSEEVWMQKDKV